MKHFILRLTFCLCITAAALVTAHASDGFQSGVPFKVPFAVDGAHVVNRGIVLVDAGGQAILTVDYVKGDSIVTLTYELLRRDPGPEPGPEPQPLPSVLWAVVVEESSERTPEQAIVLLSPEIRGLFPEGHFRLVDPLDDSGTLMPVASDVMPYVAQAVGKRNEWPLLYLVSPDGKVYFDGPMPETIKGMKTLVETHLKGGGQ